MDPRLALYEGYRDVVCVAPPGAPISPNSKMDPADLGKRPAKRGSQGWYGYGWVTDEPTHEDVERWVQWNANVGLRGTHYPAVDIDCTDPELAAKIQRWTLTFFGRAPGRGRSDSSKSLLVYRTEEPFSRVAIEIDGVHLVEILAHGRQYLCYGTHPSGAEYEWLGTPLWDIAPEDLNLMTAENVEGYLQQIEGALVADGHTVKRVGRANAALGDAPIQTELLAPNKDALRAAVAACDNTSMDRDDYIMFGCAVKAAAGEDEEEGYAIFSEWASRWDGGANEPETVRSDWRRMHPPFRVGYGWITERAEGFKSAVYEFESNPNAVPTPEHDPSEPIPVELTHDWIAEELLDDLRDKLRYDYPNDRWHVWEGGRWAHDTTGQHQRQVVYALRRLSARLRQRIAALGEKETKRYYQKLMVLGDRSMISSVTSLLQSHPALVVGVDTFDTESMELNTPDGIIDLHTGVLLPHTPANMHSKVTRVSPRNGCPRWMQFLQEATDGNQKLIDYLQKVCGYALTGERREQVLQFVWGPTSTGKSKFLEAIMYVMHEYAATASMDAFSSSKSDRHSTDMAGLMGARLVTATETQHGRSWDEQRVKAITAGDRIRARFMRQDFVEFQPRFKLLLAGNHEPKITVVDDAMRRRIHIVPFTNRPPPEKIDLDLGHKLEQEAAGILAWMVQGCLKWQTEGLNPPEVVQLRTEEYFDEENLLALWFKECCELVPGASTKYEAGTMTSTGAYASWSMWASNRGEDVGTQRDLTKNMRALELEYDFRKTSVRDTRQKGWVGVRLIAEEPTFDNERSLT